MYQDCPDQIERTVILGNIENSCHFDRRAVNWDDSDLVKGILKSGNPLKREGAMMSNEDKITGVVEYRGKKQIYSADFEADPRDDLVLLLPINFTAAMPPIKKMPNMSYEETALYQLKKLVDHEIEAKA